MPDSTMCHGDGCKLKDKCERFLADPFQYQSYFTYAPVDKTGKKCEFFVEAKSTIKSTKSKKVGI